MTSPTSANIKNLSIALEALSRIPDSIAFASKIRNLLATELDMYTKEQINRRTETQTERYGTREDDEIPF